MREVEGHMNILRMYMYVSLLRGNAENNLHFIQDLGKGIVLTFVTPFTLYA